MRENLNVVERIPYVTVVLCYLVLLSFTGFVFGYDSDYYIGYAELTANGGFADRKVVYAPLFSWTLAFFRLFKLDFGSAYFIYAAACWLVIGEIFFRASKNALLAAMALLFVLANVQVLTRYGHVMSELGYATLILITAYNLLTYVRTNTPGSLLAGIAAMALLPIQRYIGGYVVAALGLAILADVVLRRDDRALKVALIGLALASLPTIGVLTWNVVATGHISGPREPALLGIAGNAELLWSVLRKDFLPETILYVLTAAFFAVRAWKGRWRNVRPLEYVVMAVPLIQMAVQVHSSSAYFFTAINPRYVIVITPVIALLWLVTARDVRIPAVSLRGIRLPSITPRQLSLAIILLLSGISVDKSLRSPHLTAFLDRIGQSKHDPVQDFIQDLPPNTVIGLYERSWAWYSTTSEVFDRLIIPPSHCQDYRLVGSLNDRTLTYVPECGSRPGFTYKPVLTVEDMEAVDALVIRKFAKGGWRELRAKLEGTFEFHENKRYVWGRRRP